MTVRACSLAIALLLLFSCTPKAQPVALSHSWPTSPRSYEAVTRDWTRRAELHDYEVKVLEVHALVKSPEWRAAFIRQRAKHEALTPAEVQASVQEHKQQAKNYYEVELLVTTYDRRDNDLAKGSRSVWRVSLLDDRGTRIRPTEIKRDRRSRGVLKAYFPSLDDFAEAYVARFPATVDLFRADATKFSLRMASSRGSVELVWPAK